MEKIQNQVEGNEAFEKLPTEQQIHEAIATIGGGKPFYESNRQERQGKLRSVEYRLESLDDNGRIVQLDYQVSGQGVATIDVVYFDPAKGTDYATYDYDPRDIVPGYTAARYNGDNFEFID
jgi:hypothetical protein